MFPQQNSMMPFMQMMQSGQNPFASPNSSMSSPSNMAPQIPLMQGRTQSAQMPQPTSPQQPAPGYFQNMMSNPSQMGAGLTQLGGIGNGASSLMGNFGTQAAGPMMNGAAGYSTGGSGLLGALGNGTGAAASGSSPFWGGLSSMFGGSGAATGPLSLMGLGGGAGAGAAGAGAAGLGSAAGAGLGAAGAGAASGAAAGTGAAAAGGMSMADILPFLMAL